MMPISVGCFDEVVDGELLGFGEEGEGKELAAAEEALELADGV